MSKEVLKRGLLLVILSLVFFTASCSSSQQSQANQSSSESVLTETNANQRITAKTGTVLVIDLKATDGKWQVQKNNEDVLQQLGEPESKSGRQVTRFMVGGVGESNLVLAYQKAGDKNTTPAETFAVTVAAQPNK